LSFWSRSAIFEVIVEVPMTAKAPKTLSKGQMAYEQERAKKAGKSLDEWLKTKAKAEAEVAKKAAPAPVKKPGLISRLIDKAHKPL
jgi:hypothetical protein